MLENDHVKLRALEIADADRLYIWENDPEQWRISNTFTPFSRQVLIDYVTSVTDIYSDKQLRLIIERKEDGQAIGAVDLFEVDFKNQRAGIGILIADKVNRMRGMASEALKIIIPYAFHTLGLHQLYCNILRDNPGSIALFEKFGFVKAGLKRDWNMHNGQWTDEIMMQKIDGNGG